MTERYILACDERGVTRWPSRTRAYTFGGFVTKESARTSLVSTWKDIKDELCGNRTVELKWMHFFPGPHQSRVSNPLLSDDPVEWRKQALWALHRLLERSQIFPVTAVVQKDRASPVLFETKPNGRKVLQTYAVWPCVLAQFALYLKEQGAESGQAWFDQLGSQAEQERKQAEWRELLTEPWPINPENQQLLQKIDPTIRFFDSKDEAIVQLADLVSGVIWAAADGDELFLRLLLDKYAPGRHRTYGIVVLK